METCATLKDVAWSGRRRWAVMSHNEAAATSPGTGARRAGGADLSQTGVLVPLQGPVLKCECPGSRGGPSRKRGISSAENNPEGMP